MFTRPLFVEISANFTRIGHGDAGQGSEQVQPFVTYVWQPEVLAKLIFE